VDQYVLFDRTLPFFAEIYNAANILVSYQVFDFLFEYDASHQ